MGERTEDNATAMGGFAPARKGRTIACDGAIVHSMSAMHRTVVMIRRSPTAAACVAPDVSHACVMSRDPALVKTPVAGASVRSAISSAKRGKHRSDNRRISSDSRVVCVDKPVDADVRGVMRRDDIDHQCCQQRNKSRD